MKKKNKKLIKIIITEDYVGEIYKFNNVAHLQAEYTATIYPKWLIEV